MQKCFPIQNTMGKNYKVPTYYVTVSGKNDAGISVSRMFEATRFGPMKFGKHSPTRSKGWHSSNWHRIVSWNPRYESSGNERGAWVIDPKSGMKSTLIHDGWHKVATATFTTATKGCVGICGAPLGFTKFKRLPNFFVWIIEVECLHNESEKAQCDRLIEENEFQV